MTPDQITGRDVEKQALSQVIGHMNPNDGEDLLNDFISEGPDHVTNSWMSKEIEPTQDSE